MPHLHLPSARHKRPHLWCEHVVFLQIFSCLSIRDQAQRPHATCGHSRRANQHAASCHEIVVALMDNSICFLLSASTSDFERSFDSASKYVCTLRAQSMASRVTRALCLFFVRVSSSFLHFNSVLEKSLRGCQRCKSAMIRTRRRGATPRRGPTEVIRVFSHMLRSPVSEHLKPALAAAARIKRNGVRATSRGVLATRSACVSPPLPIKTFLVQ